MMIASPAITASRSGKCRAQWPSVCLGVEDDLRRAWHAELAVGERLHLAQRWRPGGAGGEEVATCGSAFGFVSG
jgi:hypothetical protein